MPALDIFNDDAFGVTSLTAAINDAQEGERVPGILDDLFEEEGITTTSVLIEREGESLSLIDSQERGASGDVTIGDKRNMIPFSCVHLPTRAGINADEVQGVRAFGSETETETVQNVVDKRLLKMRKRLDATIAYHRIGAIKGQVLDADGSVLLDLFQSFGGLEQQTVNMALGTANTKVRTKAISAKRKSEDVIGGSGMITGWRAICGRGFFDALISHNDVEKAYERWQNGEALRNDPRAGFRFGEVNWVEYYGKVGKTEFIDSDEAYLIPEGVDDLFITRFGPADYMETVNTLGLPYYAKQELRKFGKGVDLEAQSNPLNLCTKPRAIVKLTK